MMKLTKINAKSVWKFRYCKDDFMLNKTIVYQRYPFESKKSAKLTVYQTFHLPTNMTPSGYQII